MPIGKCRERERKWLTFAAAYLQGNRKNEKGKREPELHLPVSQIGL